MLHDIFSASLIKWMALNDFVSTAARSDHEFSARPIKRIWLINNKDKNRINVTEIYELGWDFANLNLFYITLVVFKIGNHLRKNIHY